jgi:putative ABC transport system substrate-binding protein
MTSRRAFISLLGGAAAVWPLEARAQQAGIPVIGFLSSASPEPFARMLMGFRRGLSEGGFVESQNVAIEYRWAEGHYDRLPAMAANLARQPVAVLSSSGGEPAARAAKAATATIPIVANFSTDPVASGLVASLNRPGGNITGISAFTIALEPKRLSLLRLLVPQAATLGVLLNPNFVNTAQQLKEIEDATRTLGLQVQVLQASTDREIDAAFDSIALLRIPALMVQGDPFFNSRRDQLVALAARHAVPAMYSFRDHVAGGGLMSYGVDLADIYRQNGIYVGRILKGAKPADLPVVQPTKFEFPVNLKTAKALGVKFSDDLLSIADEVIE